MNVAANLFFRLGLWAMLAIFALTARGVEVGVTNTYQATDPETSAWNYVGSIGTASGVFLGNYGGSGWVLTAAHVGAGSFTLGNTTYTPTGTSFTNFVYSTTTADLTLFKINGTPSLTNLSLAQPSVGSSVELIGFGGGKSWADNTIFNYSLYTLQGSSSGGPGVVTLASGLSGLGGQGVSGDSGGGLFYQSSGTWALTGILSGAGDLGSGLGFGTIAVDLAYYVSQINADINSVSAIPEPATSAAICALSAAAIIVLRRRRERRD